MRTLSQSFATVQSPEWLVGRLQREPGVVLLRSDGFESSLARYSFVVARPFLTFRSFGSRCDWVLGGERRVQYGNPWRLLESLMARFELSNELDLPFPLGGCFGYWGYELKNFIEPKLPRRARGDLDLPDCCLGFYGSLVAFDHRLNQTWIIATGLKPDGSRNLAQARAQLRFWQECLAGEEKVPALDANQSAGLGKERSHTGPILRSSLSRDEFMERVRRAQAYIHSGDIYQVNLSHRLEASFVPGGWELFQNLNAVSPAPFSAYLDCGEFQVASSSPEQFLRLSGRDIQTRPIKGTRPRAAEPTRDAQLAYELQTSPKETAELVMITDLLRNDLGKVCEFGSVHVPELLTLERYAQVQHLVSAVEGRLRPEQTHFSALSACFPGGSITGAPKFRVMELIDQLEPCARGPYTGALGYLGFNQESQLSIIIRAAVCRQGRAYFQVGAGIVADSCPQAEYQETLAKAAGFVAALGYSTASVSQSCPEVAGPLSRVPKEPHARVR